MSLVSFLPWFPFVLAEEAKTKGSVDMDTKILETIDTEQNHIHKKPLMHHGVSVCIHIHVPMHTPKIHINHCNTVCVWVWRCCGACCVVFCRFLYVGLEPGRTIEKRAKRKNKEKHKQLNASPVKPTRHTTQYSTKDKHIISLTHMFKRLFLCVFFHAWIKFVYVYVNVYVHR